MNILKIEYKNIYIYIYKYTFDLSQNLCYSTFKKKHYIF